MSCFSVRLMSLLLCLSLLPLFAGCGSDQDAGPGDGSETRLPARGDQSPRPPATADPNSAADGGAPVDEQPRQPRDMSLDLLEAEAGVIDVHTVGAFSILLPELALQFAASRHEGEDVGTIEEAAAQGPRLRMHVRTATQMREWLALGHHVDLVIVERPEDARALIDARKLSRRQLTPFAASRLILARHVDSPAGVERDRAADFALTFTGRLAIPDPDRSPIGEAVRAEMERLGWWEPLTGRLHRVGDTVTAARLLESGEVDAAIIAETDMAWTENIELVARIRSERGRMPTWYLGITEAASPEARALADYLRSEAVQPILEGAGFIRPE
ncbi:MAG: substrate-binding domain-containing protein [Phycisphaeraceae bacterium]|nr:substrate-binding domain-containing protein [Phycisphaeraceae bacterium]